MEIQKNSRQMPKIKEITSAKYYSDILYGYLQVNSKRDETNRYVEKSLINFTQLAETLGISRQTLSKRFNKLIELGLVIPPTNDSKRYTLVTLKPAEGFLIPEETLRIMGNTFNENTINVYIYLVKKFYANKEQPVGFTIQALKDFCGLGTKGDTNNYIITDILTILQKLELIYFKRNINKNEDGTIKTHYTLNKVKLTCC